MLPPWLPVLLVTTPCGIFAGLLMRSNTEIKYNGPGFQYFDFDTVPRMLASVIAIAIVGTATIFGPTFFLLWLFNLRTECDEYRQLMPLSLLCGAGIGKLIRWSLRRLR